MSAAKSELSSAVAEYIAACDPEAQQPMVENFVLIVTAIDDNGVASAYTLTSSDLPWINMGLLWHAQSRLETCAPDDELDEP